MAIAVKTDICIEDKTELLGFITYRISQLHPKLNAQAAHILREHAGLSLVQWRIIALIKAFGPKVSSTGIIKQVSMDKGLFSRALKSLIHDAMVTAETDISDHRRMLLSLSSKGKELHGNVIETMRDRQRHLMHDITDEEREILFSALAKLERNTQRIDFSRLQS